MTPKQLSKLTMMENNNLPIQIVSRDQTKPFVCTCLRRYGSYPALYTHIKNKHNGEAPGEIQRPPSMAKRGRPVKYVSPQQSVEQKKNQIFQMPDFQSIQKKVPEIFLDPIVPKQDRIQVIQPKRIKVRQHVPQDKAQIKYFLKYYQNYYRQVMKPHYQNAEQKKASQKARKRYSKIDIKKRSFLDEKFDVGLNNIDANFDLDQEEHLASFKLVQDQLQQRMKPIAKSCKQFLEWIQKITKGKVSQEVYIQSYAVQKFFLELQQFQYRKNQYQKQRQRQKSFFKQFQTQSYQNQHENQRIDCPNDQDFMEVELGVALSQFFHFLIDISTTASEKKSIHVIMMEFINYLRKSMQNQGNNMNWTLLKLADLSFYLTNSFAQTKEQKQKFDQTYVLTPDICMKLITCIHQWSAVKQYMFNKFNRYYVEKQLIQMNKIQQQYIKNYQIYTKCIKTQQKIKAKKLLSKYKKNAIAQMKRRANQQQDQQSQQNNHQAGQSSQQFQQFQREALKNSQLGNQQQDQGIKSDDDIQIAPQAESGHQDHLDSDQSEDQELQNQNQNNEDYSFQILNKNLQQNIQISQPVQEIINNKPQKDKPQQNVKKNN